MGSPSPAERGSSSKRANNKPDKSPLVPGQQPDLTSPWNGRLSLWDWARRPGRRGSQVQARAMAALWLQEFQQRSNEPPQPYPGDEAEHQPSSKRPPGPPPGLLLDEHFPMLAAERQEAPGEEAAAHPGIEELLSQLRQKDSDLILAAKLGKALLERNQELSSQFEMMQRELTDKLE
eukprot:g26926.t1